MLLVWVGDKNYTFGVANEKTGLYSLHGRFYKFKSLEDRQYFLDNYRSSLLVYVIPCTHNTGRKFMLGCSVKLYNEMLNSLDYYTFNDL